MSRKIPLTLTDAQRTELEHERRHGKSHQVRERARMVLLKADGTNSKDIIKLVDVDHVASVNTWVWRYIKGYAEHGISVLHNKSGQGRKRKLDPEKHCEIVKNRVIEDRQRLNKAKELLEEDLGIKMHIVTLRRFLKTLTAGTSD